MCRAWWKWAREDVVSRKKPTLSMHWSRSVTSSRWRASVARRNGTNKPRMTWWKEYGLDADSTLPLSIRLLSRNGQDPTSTNSYEGVRTRAWGHTNPGHH